jgi:hypothetical protein
MNAILRPMLRGAVLVAVMSLSVATAQPQPATGKVLLFDHGGIIEGDIIRDGEKFRVRHGSAVSIIQAKGIVGLFADKDAVLKHLEQKANLTDPKERVRLARWCQAQGMRQAAVAQAEAALALAPKDASLKQFLDRVKLFAASMPGMDSPESPIKQASAQPESAAIDISPESIGLFATKIHPILMNACAKCHASDPAAKFKLTRAGGPGTQRAVQANLAAASAYLNRDLPVASALLVKAVSVHGGSGVPPLKDRQTAAYRHLEDWVQRATGNPIVSAPAPLPGSVVAESQPLPAMVPPMRPRDAANDPPAPVITTSAPIDPMTQTKPANKLDPSLPKIPEPVKPSPGDPFDPAIFNQGGKPPNK